jgi:hypothetical protein
MNLDLTDEEALALIRLLRDAIEDDRYPLSQLAPQVGVLHLRQQQHVELHCQIQRRRNFSTGERRSDSASSTAC